MLNEPFGATVAPNCSLAWTVARPPDNPGKRPRTANLPSSLSEEPPAAWLRICPSAASRPTAVPDPEAPPVGQAGPSSVAREPGTRGSASASGSTVSTLSLRPAPESEDENWPSGSDNERATSDTGMDPRRVDRLQEASDEEGQEESPSAPMPPGSPVSEGNETWCGRLRMAMGKPGVAYVDSSKAWHQLPNWCPRGRPAVVRPRGCDGGGGSGP